MSPVIAVENLSKKYIIGHYRTLMRVENNAARQFYETEAVQSNWSRRDLERQIGNLFYERLLASTDKTAMLKSVRHEAITLTQQSVIKATKTRSYYCIPERSWNKSGQIIPVAGLVFHA